MFIMKRTQHLVTGTALLNILFQPWTSTNALSTTTTGMCDDNDNPNDVKVLFAATWGTPGAALDAGWRLECDDGQIYFDVPPNTYDQGGGDWYWRELCVSSDLTCTLTVLGNEGWGPGSFYMLEYDYDTVAYYNDASAFAERTHCFGPGCNESTAEDDAATECEIIYLAVQTDAHPQEWNVLVECSSSSHGETPPLWNLTFDDNDNTQGGDLVVYEECLVPSSMCGCSIAVTDTGNDGGTIPFNGTTYGEVYLEWAGNRVLYYQGRNGMEFGRLQVGFANNGDCA